MNAHLPLNLNPNLNLNPAGTDRQIPLEECHAATL